MQRVITFPKAGPVSLVRFTYNKDTKTLYIEIYAVDEALAGNHLGTDYLRRALAEAEKHGPVDAVKGKAGRRNAQILQAAGSKMDPARIADTPWAKAWDALGWKSELVGTVMTTTRK